MIVKHPGRSTALTPVKRIADMMPIARPVLDHLSARLGVLGKTPAFYREASNYLGQCALAAEKRRHTLRAQLYHKAAQQLARSA